MKILLADPIGTGHHQEYLMLLAGGLKELGMRVYFLGPSGLLNSLVSASFLEDGISCNEMHAGSNFFANERGRVDFFQDTLSASRRINADICHFLYLDHFLISAICSGIIKKQKAAVCATLHSIYFLPDFAPTGIHRLKGKIDFAALRFLVLRGLRVMVHSEKISQTMVEFTGCRQFDYVPYPVKAYPLNDDDKRNMRSILRDRLGLAQQNILLMVFGGTRQDKGADLAVKMLSLLPGEYHLLFAGKDTYFSRTFLEDLSFKHHVADRVHFDNHFIPDNEVPVYFCGCDILLIPYRKSFSGQSGPLTIAAALGTKIVAPDLPVFAETLAKNSLGYLYPAENLDLMARAVEQIMKLTLMSETGIFFDNHSPQAFVNAVFSSYTSARLGWE